MRVRFGERYHYIPSGEPAVTVLYAAGFEGTVKRECGEAAVKAGKAEEVEAFNGADPAAFDHDGDGEPGGSRPRRKKADVKA